MRNGQNNKRMRNRNNNNNNNNRRGQNPMTRVFESNGPDIKIRGTASHIAEKYVQLARDARTKPGPIFRTVKVMVETLSQTMPPKDGAYLKDRFRHAVLGTA